VAKKRIEGTQITGMPLSTFTIVSPGTSVIDAAKLMITRKTRLLVYDEKRLIGIITSTDMVRAFRHTNSNPPLEKVISNNLYTVKEDDDIFKAVKIMYEKRIGSVIVTKHKSPYGIFTERDLLVNVLSNDADIKNPVIGYCSYPLVTAEFGIKGSDAAKIMAENKIKRLILTKQGKVSAIVTARDIVDAFQSSFSSEEI
jgi:CBS domain-containing protein